MMKRIVCLILAFMMSLGLALGEAAVKFEEPKFIRCTCGHTPCDCFVREGDGHRYVEIFTDELKARGYLSENHARTIFDQETTEAIKAFQADCGIEQTGTFNDETLWYIYGDATDEQLAALLSFRNYEFLYIPTDGGRKIHCRMDCCNIKFPRIISVNTAAILNADKSLLEKDECIILCKFCLEYRK